MKTKTGELNIIDLTNDTYRVRCFLLIGDSDIAKAFFEDHNTSFDLEECDHAYFEKGFDNKEDTGYFICYLRSFNKESPIDMSLLCHEIFHITTHVMEYVGIKLCDNSDEAYSYFLDSTLRRALTELYKSKGKTDE